MTAATAPNSDTSGRSALERQRAALAAALGETNINLTEAKYLDLLRDGVIIDLEIHHWRASTVLDNDDLGLPRGLQALEDDGSLLFDGGSAFDTDEEDTTDTVQPDQTLSLNVVDELEKAIRLGTKRLLPNRLYNAIGSAETTARKCLDRYATKTAWGHFVPATLYQVWKRENAGIKARFYALRDEIGATYSSIRREVAAIYAQQAREAYRRRMRLAPDSMTDQALRIEANFVNAFVRRIMEKMPTRQELIESFSYDVTLSFVPLPALLAADEPEDEAAREVRRQREDELAYAQMRREVIEQAKEQHEELIGGLLTSATTRLRSLLYEALTDVLASVGKNRKLVGKSAKQLADLVQELQGLNFYRDVEMDAAIKKLQAIVNTPVKDRSMGDIEGQLRELATFARASLLDLGDEPRSARALGIEDAPTIEMVRSARESLFGSPVQAMPTLAITNGREL